MSDETSHRSIAGWGTREADRQLHASRLSPPSTTYTTFGQRFDRPFKHKSHAQQLTPGSMETLSPTLKSLTFVPTSKICPADSWPRIISWVTQQSPIRPVFQKWISDPQIPVAFWNVRISRHAVQAYNSRHVRYTSRADKMEMVLPFARSCHQLDGK